MKTCKLKPNYHICCSCIDYQVDNHIILNCDKCMERDNNDYEIIKEGKTFFGKKFVVILKNGVEVKIKTDQIYDVKETMD